MAESVSHTFETPLEASMQWQESELATRQQLREDLGQDVVEEFFTETEEKCFIKGYTSNGYEKIKKQMQDMIAYKKKINYNKMLNEEFIELPMIASALPCAIFGQDRQGHPILYCKLSQTNYDIVKQFSDMLDTMFHRVFAHLKVVKEKISEETGTEIFRHTSVIDAKNLGILDVKSVYKTMATFFEICNSKYPETAHKIIIVNTDWKFKMIKKLFDWAIEEVTAEKIKIVGSKYDLSKLANIDPDQIPTDFGGKASVPFQAGTISLTKCAYPATQF